MKRLLLLLLVAGVVWYLLKSNGVLSPASSAAPRGSPAERARAAASASDARTAAGDALAKESDQPAGAGVTENMTREQVRALLGPPDDVQSETLASGATRETWTYRSVGKSVVFENGIVESIR